MVCTFFVYLYSESPISERVQISYISLANILIPASLIYCFRSSVYLSSINPYTYPYTPVPYAHICIDDGWSFMVGLWLVRLESTYIYGQDSAGKDRENQERAGKGRKVSVGKGRKGMERGERGEKG